MQVIAAYQMYFEEHSNDTKDGVIPAHKTEIKKVHSFISQH